MLTLVKFQRSCFSKQFCLLLGGFKVADSPAETCALCLAPWGAGGYEILEEVKVFILAACPGITLMGLGNGTFTVYFLETFIRS